MRAVILLAILVGLANPACADAVSDAEAAANTAKTLAEARKAQAEADLATLKAKLGGDIPASYTGTVTTGAGAGTIEAQVLAAQTIQASAKTIVGLVKDATKSTVVLLVNADIPKFDSLISFRMGTAVFEAAYGDAAVASDNATRSVPPATPATTAPSPAFGLEAAPVATAALGLDALNKILGFFKTDYSIAGVTLSIDDSLLLHALAGELAAMNKSVILPIQYGAGALDTQHSPILQGFLSAATHRGDAQIRSSRHDAAVTDLNARAQSDQAKKDEKLKNLLVESARLNKEAGDKCKAVSALFDSLFGKLAVADDKGAIPIALIVKEAAIEATLEKPGATLLIVKNQSASGSYYTKKNLWTSLGAMPFFVAGGAVISFVLLNGGDGTVLAAGVVPNHGGYHAIDKVEKAGR